MASGEQRLEFRNRPDVTRTLQKILRLASCIQKYVPGENTGVNIFQHEGTKFLLTQTGLIVYSESVDPPEELSVS